MAQEIVSFDYAVKNLFRDKAYFGILSGFLSELLNRDIVVQEILESERNKTHEDDKFNRLDLKAKIDDGEIVIFEVQVERQGDFFKRMMYGASTAVTEQLSSGDDYEKIKKVYSIDIVYFELGKGSDYIYHGTTDFKGLHNNETLLLSESEDKLMLGRRAGDLFPEYYLIYPQKFDENIKNKFDEWVYTLKKSEVEAEFSAAGIQDAGVKLNVQKMSHDERIRYNNFIKWRRVQSGVFTSALYDEQKKWQGVVAEKDAVIADQAVALADQAALIAALKAQLGEETKDTGK